MKLELVLLGSGTVNRHFYNIDIAHYQHIFSYDRHYWQTRTWVKLSNEVLENMMLVRISLRNVLFRVIRTIYRTNWCSQRSQKKNSEVFDQLKPMIHTEGTKLCLRRWEARKNYVAAVNTFLPLADISSAQYDEVKAKQYLFGDYAKRPVSSPHK